MALVLENSYATSLQTSSSSGTISNIKIGSQNDRFIVVAVSSNNIAFSTVNSIYLSSPARPNDGYAFTRKVQSSGTEIWWIKEPAHTPGISTAKITVNLSGNYDWAAAAYVFYNASQSGNLSFETFGFDAQSTGEPQSPSAVSMTEGSYCIDAVRIAQNTLLPNSPQISKFNISNGAGVNLRSYGSSYFEVPSSTTYQPGWTRQPIVLNASWAYCFVTLKVTTNTYAKVIAS